MMQYCYLVRDHAREKARLDTPLNQDAITGSEVNVFRVPDKNGRVAVLYVNIRSTAVKIDYGCSKRYRLTPACLIISQAGHSAQTRQLFMPSSPAIKRTTVNHRQREKIPLHRNLSGNREQKSGPVHLYRPVTVDVQAIDKYSLQRCEISVPSRVEAGTEA
jgi:hypothetical protein